MLWWKKHKASLFCDSSSSIVWWEDLLRWMGRGGYTDRAGFLHTVWHPAMLKKCGILTCSRIPCCLLPLLLLTFWGCVEPAEFLPWLLGAELLKKTYIFLAFPGPLEPWFLTGILPYMFHLVFQCDCFLFSMELLRPRFVPGSGFHSQCQSGLVNSDFLFIVPEGNKETSQVMPLLGKTSPGSHGVKY